MPPPPPQKNAWDYIRAVLIKLYCRICRMMRSFIGEICFHIDVPVVSKCHLNCQGFAFFTGTQTDLGATYPPGIIPIPMESLNLPFESLWITAVGERAKFAGTS